MARDETLRELAWIEAEANRMARETHHEFRWRWLFRVGVFICKCVAK